MINVRQRITQMENVTRATKESFVLTVVSHIRNNQISNVVNVQTPPGISLGSLVSSFSWSW